MLEVTDETFESEVQNATEPVMVDFWAPWCQPCVSFMPVLEELERREAHRIKFCKMNVDENEAIPAMLGIRSVPTLAIFQDGEVKEVAVGTKTKGQLDGLVARY